jgi:hypothetical protein
MSSLACEELSHTLYGHGSDTFFNSLSELRGTFALPCNEFRGK